MIINTDLDGRYLDIVYNNYIIMITQYIENYLTNNNNKIFFWKL